VRRGKIGERGGTKPLAPYGSETSRRLGFTRRGEGGGWPKKKITALRQLFNEANAPALLEGRHRSV